MDIKVHMSGDAEELLMSNAITICIVLSEASLSLKFEELPEDWRCPETFHLQFDHRCNCTGFSPMKTCIQRALKPQAIGTGKDQSENPKKLLASKLDPPVHWIQSRLLWLNWVWLPVLA